MTRLFSIAVAGTLLAGIAPLPVSATAATTTPTPMRPYCSATFAIWLSSDERIDYAKSGPLGRYVFYTDGRKLALGDETSRRLPVGATVGSSHDLPTARVTELFTGGRQIGYVFENAKRGVRTIMLSPDLSGYPKDKKLLKRFDFGTERTCATIGLR